MIYTGPNLIEIGLEIDFRNSVMRKLTTKPESLAFLRITLVHECLLDALNIPQTNKHPSILRISAFTSRKNCIINLPVLLSSNILGCPVVYVLKSH